ncbi:MAG TPA: hypothetical protein DHV48_03700 [Prolixibacteraceae bacterium]|nr:hypothetical protein [Prolixibacteraceae bacterium]
MPYSGLATRRQPEAIDGWRTPFQSRNLIAKNKMKEFIYENVTPERLVEIFGGEIIEKDGGKIYVAPSTKKEHAGFVCKMYFRENGIAVSVLSESGSELPFIADENEQEMIKDAERLLNAMYQSKIRPKGKFIINNIDGFKINLIGEYADVVVTIGDNQLLSSLRVGQTVNFK